MIVTFGFLPILLAALVNPGPGTRTYDFGMVSDSHWTGPEYYADGKGVDGRAERQQAWLKRETANLARAAELCLSAPAARFVVHTGDLVDGVCGNLTRQVRQLEDGWRLTRGAFPKDLPFLPANGNHETYDFEAPGTYAYPAYEKTVQRYAANELGRKDPVARHYSFAYGPDLFIVYNSNVDEYDFVKETLAAHPDARYVFAVGHIPAINPCVGGIEIDSPWAGNFMENHNRFLRLLQSRDVILLCGDTHRLGLVDYVTGEGRLTELMGVSVWDHSPYRELTAEPAGFPISWNSSWRSGMPISPRQKFLKGGLVRFWGAVGAGFWKLHVSDEAVTADLYVWGREGVAKSLVLRGSSVACAPVAVEVTPPLTSGVNRLSVRIPAAGLTSLTNLQWRADLPDGWTAQPFDPERGVLEVTLPRRAMPTREEVAIRLSATDAATGRIVANEDRHFLQQDDGGLVADSDGLLISESVPNRSGVPVPPADRFYSVRKGFSDENELWKHGDGLLELFFDVKNLKKVRSDGDAVQIVVMRLSDDPTRWRALVIRDGGKTHAWTDLPKENGFIRVPWKLVAPSDDPGFLPGSGEVIGFDAAFANRPLTGGKAKLHDDPSTWGRMRLYDWR